MCACKLRFNSLRPMKMCWLLRILIWSCTFSKFAYGKSMMRRSLSEVVPTCIMMHTFFCYSMRFRVFVIMDTCIWRHWLFSHWIQQCWCCFELKLGGCPKWIAWLYLKVWIFGLLFACICDLKFCAYVLCIWFEVFMH